MAQKNFVIDMTISLEGLHGFPEGHTPQQVFYFMMLQFLMAWAKQSKGADLKSQKMFYKIRSAMENSIKVKDPSFNLEIEEMEFLNLVRTEVKLDFEANEAIMRVNNKIDEAVKNFESKYGKGEVR